jgi:hypothetical protein
MSNGVTFGSRQDPPAIEALLRKKRSLTDRCDALDLELETLQHRKEEVAASSLNGGGERAERLYDRLVEQVENKVREVKRLHDAIAGVVRQLGDERQRLENEKQAKIDADNQRRKEAYLKIKMREVRERLEYVLPRALDSGERREIELQLEHVREIAEAEYFNEVGIYEVRQHRTYMSNEAPPPFEPPPQPIKMVQVYPGLPSRPAYLGEKK